MKEVVIVSGARTAVGEFGGSLKGVSVVEMGRLVIKEAIMRAGLRPAISADIKSFRPKPFADLEMTEINKKYYDYDKAPEARLFRRGHHGQRPQCRPGPEPAARQSAIYAGLPEETNAYSRSRRSAPPA